MLALKLLLVPALVGLMTLAGRRWGPAVAGWLSGFPVIAAPILLLIAVEQGPLFATGAAAGALSGVLANTAFCLGYSWAATRLPWWGSLSCALGAYAVAGYALHALALPLYASLALVIVGLLLALRAFPPIPRLKQAKPPSVTEIPARMLAGVLLVLTVTYFAAALGPRISGLLSAFPLLATILATFSHTGSGAGFAILLLRGMTSGFFAMMSFCFVLALALPQLGIGAGFGAALASAMLVHGGMLWLRSPTTAKTGR